VVGLGGHALVGPQISLEREPSAVPAGVPPHLFLGVTIAFLREFALRHGITEDAHSHQVRALVQELTAACECSMAELQLKEPVLVGHPPVGQASLFVSHAHSCVFLRMVAAVEAHLELHEMRKESTYVWIDLFPIRGGGGGGWGRVWGWWRPPGAGVRSLGSNLRPSQPLC
jgi:hypothetical protein